MPRVFNFNVIPALPERLRGLDELSLNLRWTWDHATIELFRSLDPDLWEETRHNPRLMLGRAGQRRLVELASDEVFLAQLDRAATSLKQYLSSTGGFLRAHPEAAGLVFSYFSAEFGITECLPIYAG